MEISEEQLEDLKAHCNKRVDTNGIWYSDNMIEEEWVRPLLDEMEGRFGKMYRVWIAVQEPGADAIDWHHHLHGVFIVYPFGHENGLMYGDPDRPETIKQNPGPKPWECVMVLGMTKHKVPANNTDVPRISIMFELAEGDWLFEQVDEACKFCKKWRKKLPLFVQGWLDKVWPL